MIVTIARRDGDDAPRYLEKLVEAALIKLESIADGTHANEDESDEV